MKDEREILERLHGGDDAAFAEMVRNHQKEVHMLALRLLGDQEEALNISQLTFIKAHKGLKNFRGDSSISTWLYRITYNLCMKRLASARWKRFIPLEDSFTAEPSTNNAQNEIERSDFRENLQKAVDKLPAQQKAVFVMHQLEGLKLSEVASIMNRKLGTIKALHYHAVLKLRSALKEWKYAEFSA